MELLTRSLNADAITSRCSLSRGIGRGSSSQDFDGADLTIALIVSSSISENSSNFASVVWCYSIYFGSIGLSSLDLRFIIMVSILSLKYLLNSFVRSSFESCSGNGLSVAFPSSLKDIA